MVDLQQSISTHIKERLLAESIIWLSSMRPDGRPHLVPVWYLWEAESSTILIFSKPENQKIRNIRSNPAVMLALETKNHGDDVLMLEGTATMIDDPTLKATLPIYAEKYATHLQRMNYTAESMAQDYSQAIRVKLKKVISWS